MNGIFITMTIKKFKVKGYGFVAIKAASLVINERLLPIKAWREAMLSSNKAWKPCPGDAFITLCQNGFVKGIEKLPYLGITYKSNIELTLRAFMSIDFENPDFSNYADLWRKAHILCSENGHISVIHGLYDAGLLELD